MNDQTPFEELPELSDETIARMENSVFAQIAEERTPVAHAATRSHVRRRRWLTGAGIAAAFAVGVIVTPPILGAVGSGSMTITAESSDMSGGSVADSGGGSTDRSTDVASEDASGDVPATSGLSGAESGDADREIVTTANVTLQVKDIPDAADAVTALAEKHGGYVESTQVGKDMALDDTSAPAPADQGYGWISVRVPSADLSDVIRELGDSGDVLSSSISKQDVTATAIDLRARVNATKASVQRLTELMAQSGSVSELIEAEVALTDRQAQLESWEQQLAAVEDQVAMSTLQVELTRAAAPTTADPAGFTDGVLAGWNGLVVSLNALVIAVGFILPWLGIAAVIALIFWLIRRARRARRAEPVSTETTTD
ncbi:DUF4349 domain-containing protein [Microbacterium sp. SSW1-49]|uniref:DUF4349 domain-containing protein n=1 Tax=Microbacterium croceum TaxID=2851645 RepID=A0ABT0FEW4_9MICO|nr:DUF4349 domain-containing protein [Microbacterium croceum]MCK2036603.1 DUF4349 domain-containing protein [Microbacterium croceum]